MKRKKRIDYKDFLEMLRNIASHFCTAKVMYKKMPIYKKQDPISEALYPDSNITIAIYSSKLNQIWVNKRKAVIDLYAKYPEAFLHEIRHAIQPPSKPKRWTVKDVLK